VTEPPRTLETLSAAELDAVATLWGRERWEFLTSFTGTSMLPAIAPGQQVLVQCGVEPVIGDVAVFRFDNQVGVHRVVARTASWLLTWGDANPLPDEPILPGQVIGTVRNPRAAPRSLHRSLLRRFLAPPSAPIDRVTRRVRLVHRIRTVWGQGPLVFAAAVVCAIVRRLSPRRA
jgi:Peptidase S24-like